MADRDPRSSNPCPECGGAGVEFRGRGNDAAYRVCSRWQEPGHPTKDEIQKKVTDYGLANYPASGRFA